MFKRTVLVVSLALAVVALLLGAGHLAATDVSQFLTQDSSASLSWGNPGGIAYDGSNFLIAAQSTNGGIIAIRLATNGTMPSPSLDLGRTGGVPRVAFDGGNYLVVWPDFGDPPSDIYGQFIRPDGTTAGNPFLIEADMDAEEIGGVAFDGTNYLAVWETYARNTNAVSTVQGRFITSTGDLPGPLLQVSDGATRQKFPNVAWNGENYLVIWTGQTEGTNEWNVQGRRFSRTGVPLDSLTINESPAQAAWPPTLASDGTNWLAAWCRESGPYLIGNSNAWLPMLYSRVVGQNGSVSGQEFEIRRSNSGQLKPAAAFNGSNYLVAWVEKQFSYRWRPAARQVTRSGEPFMAEVFFWPNLADASGLVLSQGAGRFVCAWQSPFGLPISESFFIQLNRSFVLRNLTRLPSGDVQLDLVGPTNWSYGFEISTNLVNWSSVLGFNSHRNGRNTIPLSSLSGTGDRNFFRAFDGQTACIENLRLIQQAKDRWALEHNKGPIDTPTDSDLFGPGRYLMNKPVCPNGGTYWPGHMVAYPMCSLAFASGHTY